MRTTLGYLQLGWLGTCVAGWLLVALTAESEAECMARAYAAGEFGFFCFTRKAALIVYGIEFAVFWFIGALVTWGLYAMVVWMQAVSTRAHERRRLQSATPPSTPFDFAEHEDVGEAASRAQHL